VIPPPPTPDEIDAALSVIGFRLRQMNRKNQLDIIQQVMNITYEKLKEDAI